MLDDDPWRIEALMSVPELQGAVCTRNLHPSEMLELIKLAEEQRCGKVKTRAKCTRPAAGLCDARHLTKHVLLIYRRCDSSLARSSDSTPPQRLPPRPLASRQRPLKCPIWCVFAVLVVLYTWPVGTSILQSVGGRHPPCNCKIHPAHVRRILHRVTRAGVACRTRCSICAAAPLAYGERASPTM